MSLRRRLVLLTAAAVSLAIVLASVVTYAIVRDNLRGQVDSALRELAPQVTIAPAMTIGGRASGSVQGSDRAPTEDDAVAIRKGEAVGPPPEDGLSLARPARKSDVTAEKRRLADAKGKKQFRVFLPRDELGGPTGVAQVITSTGSVLSTDATAALPVDSAVRAVARGELDLLFQDVTIRDTHARMLTIRDPIGGAIQIVRPLSEVDDTLGRLRWILLGVCLGGLAVGGGLGLAVSRATVRPVARLTETAEQVTETGDLGHRIEQHGEDELGRLARSFNRMLGALEASRDAQRSLVADASHELRTPLTSARANIELLQRAHDLPEAERAKALGDVREQLEELTVLVGDLVDLARPREQLVEEPEDLALDGLVAEAVARAQRNAPHVRFALDRSPGLVRGSRTRLSRAVSNLLDNAAKFSPDGGDVEVVVRDGTVTVRDHGPGLAPADLPHVFDRFWRSSSARGLPGSGLGLAIVRHVAEGHGGRVDASNAPGGGALLTLTLPPADGDPASRPLSPDS